MEKKYINLYCISCNKKVSYETENINYKKPINSICIRCLKLDSKKIKDFNNDWKTIN